MVVVCLQLTKALCGHSDRAFIACEMGQDFRVPRSRLDVVDDAELVWRVVEPVFNAVDIYAGQAKLASDLESLSLGQRSLLALHWCVSEVSNGGFDQFFTNPSGLLVTEAVKALERVEATGSARVLREAIEVFASRPKSSSANEPDFDEADEAELFDAYMQRQAPLENQFYELMDTELYPRAAAYVRRNAEEFAK